MRATRLWALVWVIALSGAVAGTRGVSAATAPRTVVSVPGVIQSFALGPGRIAWIEATWELRDRRLASGRTTTIRYTSQYEEGGDTHLSFAGSRLLWLGNRGYPDVTNRVFTTTGSGAVRVLKEALYTDATGGAYVTGPVGDPAGGAFGVVSMHSPGDCPCTVTGGVWTVGNGVARRVPGVPAPIALARSGNLLLVAPAAAASKSPPPWADSAGTVEVRSLPDGATVTRFTPDGSIMALALTSRFAFVVVLHRSTATRPRFQTIEVYDPHTGALVRSVEVVADGERVLPGNPPQLAASGRWVVFHDARTVSALDGASGRIVHLARTSAKCVEPYLQGRCVTGLAAWGTTVAWTEQRGVGDETRRKGTTTVIWETTLD